MKIHVQIVQGPSANHSFYVEKDSRFIVGRGESASFQIEDDELLSREHFAMDFDGDQLTLTDLGSTNGTFVNGHPLTHRPVILKDNQQFVAGRVSRFEVQFIGQLEKKADAKTTPSIAAASVPPEKHPTPPAPMPASNPNTNFGTSIYSGGEATPSQAPPPSTSSNSEGGNFSQSVVTGFSDSAGPEQGSLLYSNPPSPTPSIAQPAKKTEPPVALPDRGELPPLPKSLSDDDFGSIAAPGGEGFPDTFAPLGGSQPNVPLTQVPPPEEAPACLPPLPGFTSEPSSQAPASPSTPGPASSPFASIHQPAAPQPVPTPPPASQATEAPQPPQLRQEVPTERSPIDPQSPFGAAGSIYSPGQIPQASPPPQEAVPIQSSSGHAGSSIGMPGQIPVARQRREVARPVKADLPPGKIGFQVRQFENGLFAHSGAEASDVERIKSVLGSKFEAVFCAHLSRTEIDFSTKGEPAEAPQMVEPDLGASPFEDVGDEEGDADSSGDSPFEELEEEKEQPTPEPEEPTIPKVGTPLFSWFPKESQWENPILLTNEEFSYSMEELWQQDALVSLFGSSSKQMTEHCLDLVQTNIRNGKKGAMFGFCWPSVLEGTLESQGEKQISRIFAGGVAAILLEDPQEEFGWNIISRNDMTQSLIDSGLVLLPT